jgi:hypothetical protein
MGISPRRSPWFTRDQDAGTTKRAVSGLMSAWPITALPKDKKWPPAAKRDVMNNRPECTTSYYLHSPPIASAYKRK